MLDSLASVDPVSVQIIQSNGASSSSSSMKALLISFEKIFSFLFSSFLKENIGNSFRLQVETKMVAAVSRTGRENQVYRHGRRQVVGCIPYKYRINEQSSSVDANLIEELEVLLISSQKGHAMLFPKGGWEHDETMEHAAERETLEEAGVVGKLESRLGKWRFKSKSLDIFHDGYMFPLLVTKQLDIWPEKDIRKRRWVTVAEARELCQNWWMKEALDVLISRLQQLRPKKEEDEALCT